MRHLCATSNRTPAKRQLCSERALASVKVWIRQLPGVFLCRSSGNSLCLIQSMYLLCTTWLVEAFPPQSYWSPWSSSGFVSHQVQNDYDFKENLTQHMYMYFTIPYLMFCHIMLNPSALPCTLQATQTPAHVAGLYGSSTIIWYLAEAWLRRGFLKKKKEKGVIQGTADFCSLSWPGSVKYKQLSLHTGYLNIIK